MSLKNRLLRRSWHYVRWNALRQYTAKVDQSLPPVVVLQMGKVGSSSVVRTLEAGLTDHFVHHVHFLSDEFIERVEGQFKAAKSAKRGYHLDQHVAASRYLNKYLTRDLAGKKPLLVSLVRDPVARNLSAFFQAFPVYFASPHQQRNATGSMAEFSADELERMFLDEFGEYRHNLPLTWFDEHIKAGFGLDIFADTFDQEAGYSLFENDQCSLLVLTVESLPDSLVAGMSALLGVKSIEVLRDNTATDKAYGDAYQQFMRTVRLSEEYLDRMYDSDFAKFFYPPDSIAKFRARWTR
ncbi:MAG: putative capsular polysaccharide synthesis family protein [Halioglobus sp.]